MCAVICGNCGAQCPRGEKTAIEIAGAYVAGTTAETVRVHFCSPLCAFEGGQELARAIGSGHAAAYLDGSTEAT